MIVSIDNLPVEVDEDKWNADPEAVTKAVRANRQAVRISGIAERDREPDYNTLYPDEGKGVE